MKKLLLILFIIPFFAIGQKTVPQLQTQNNSQIKLMGTSQLRSFKMYDSLIQSSVNLLGSYSNPSWITSLGLSKITGLGTGWNSPLGATLGTGWAAAFAATYSSGTVSSITGTANQISVSPTIGAVIVSLASAISFPGTWTQGTLGYSDTGILNSTQGSTNSYIQSIIQNTNSGSAASTNLVISSDNGTATTHFLEVGKNSSGFSNGSGSFNLPNASYLDDASDDLVIGTLANKTLHFVTNNSTIDAMSISGNGLITLNAPINGNSLTTTFSTTANNQYSLGLLGTITSRASASDIVTGFNVSQTLVSSAASQTLQGVLINTTFTDINSATKYILKLQSGGVDKVAIGSTGYGVFTSSSSLPAINVSSNGASDPSTTINGDLWSITSGLRGNSAGSPGYVALITGIPVTGAIPVGFNGSIPFFSSSSAFKFTSGVLTVTGNIQLPTAGNKLLIAEGANAYSGQVALVSGTKAISISGVTTSSRCLVQRVVPSSASLTVQYDCVCTSGTVTIQADLAATTINTSDVSTLNYWIWN